MQNKIIIADKRSPASQGMQQLNLELAEIREISDIIFRKLEGKIKEVQVIEASIDRKKSSIAQMDMLVQDLNNKLAAGRELSETLDKKIATLQQLLQHADSMTAPGEGMNRQQEIVALISKGLASREIAEVLDMPQGEVELIVNLHHHAA